MKNNNKQFISKCINALRERIIYFNVRNINVRSLAYREYCYKKLKRKYRKLLKREDYTLEKKSDYVWICWFQGMDNAPELVKSCYDSVKKYMKNKKIIIITEKNYKEYISFPEYIEKKYMKGIIPRAHFSDLLRLELLTKYGGIWVDATVYLTGSPSILENDNVPLFVFKNITLNRRAGLAVVASSWLIMADKNEPILNLTKKLSYRYWQDNNMLINYNVFHILFTLATEVYNDEWFNVPTFSNIPPHILQFELLEKYNNRRYEEIKKMSNIHKLNHRIKTDDKSSNYYHILNIGDVKNEK